MTSILHLYYCYLIISISLFVHFLYSVHFVVVPAVESFYAWQVSLCFLPFHLSPQVLGNAKGAVAVVVSILIFRNPVSVTGMLGYSLTVFGVVLYSEAKKRSK